MIVGITKILILLPFLPYLVFLLTSKNRKIAHVYCGPIVLLSNVTIISYILDVSYTVIVLILYILTTLFLATKKTKRKRSPKRFGLNVLFFFSWLGFKLYVIFVVIGIVQEVLN